MSQFSNLLNAILADVSGDETIPELEGLSDDYIDTIKRIDAVKSELEELFHCVDVIKKKTLAALAVLAKSKEPDIDISLSDTLTLGDKNTACKIIDPASCMVNSEVKTFESPLEMSEFVIDLIVPECRNGEGRILLEGKKASYLKLRAYKESLDALC